MADSIKYAGAGALTGLAAGILIRKLIAGKQNVGLGSYALWGGAGAGLGGLVGYTAAAAKNYDPNTPSENQKLENKKTIEENLPAYNALKDEKPGIFQGDFLPDLTRTQWGTLLAGVPTMAALTHTVNKRIADAYNVLKEIDNDNFKGPLKNAVELFNIERDKRSWLHKLLGINVSTKGGAKDPNILAYNSLHDALQRRSTNRWFTKNAVLGNRWGHLLGPSGILTNNTKFGKLGRHAVAQAVPLLALLAMGAWKPISTFIDSKNWSTLINDKYTEKMGLEDKLRSAGYKFDPSDMDSQRD